METQTFYAIKVTAEGKEALAFKQGKGLYFCTEQGGRTCQPIPPPALFHTKKETKEAIKNNCTVKNLKTIFKEVCEHEKREIVKVNISLN